MKFLDRLFEGYSRQERRWVLGVLALGLFLRLAWLSFPHAIVFDETYFANFANSMLQGTLEVDVHPALGKLLIASGIKLFGFSQFGYRIIIALASCLVLVFLIPLLQRLFNSGRAAALAFGLFSANGLFLVYGRLALLETLMLLFAVASLLALTEAKRSTHSNDRTLSLIIAGLLAGLCISIKWIGAGIIPTLWVWWYLLPGEAEQRPRSPVWRRHQITRVLALTALPIGIYLATFAIPLTMNHSVIDLALKSSCQTETSDLPYIIDNANYWQYLIGWHRYALSYNVHLCDTHPYAAKAWTWPLLKRPIWFYFQESQTKLFGKTVEGIIAMGHPLLHWASSLAILAALVWQKLRRQKVVLALLFAWAAFYLPWLFIGRVLFLYHYFFPSFFATLLLAAVLDELLKHNKTRDAALVFLIVSGFFFFFWLPLWVGLPIPEWFYGMHLWFRSWI